MIRGEPHNKLTTEITPGNMIDTTRSVANWEVVHNRVRIKMRSKGMEERVDKVEE